MTREKRLIVILLAIGGVGIAALAVLAHRFGTQGPQRSVRELAPPAASSSDTPAHRVDGFVAARKAASGVLARYPVKFKQIAAAFSGNYDAVKGERTGIDIDAMGAYKIERYEALQAAGMSQAGYEAVRAAWRAWKSGGAVDPALAAAFEAKRELLGLCDLGPYEAFDGRVN